MWEPRQMETTDTISSQRTWPGSIRLSGNALDQREHAGRTDSRTVTRHRSGNDFDIGTNSLK